MQESFDIHSSTGSYHVVVGENLLAGVIADYPDAIFIVDAHLTEFLPKSISKLILIEAKESSKSLERMPEIILKMREAGANRASHMVAIGGGVIQDIATFTASIYMRGILWTYLPTTLLGMTDSCIGGKSSINTLGYKNIVGNFYPPKDVRIDMIFIKTLNTDQVVGGFYEAAKICYARGYENFLSYLAESPGYPISVGNAQRVIMLALKTKKWFIETDEFDQKERLLLNFGHTFGHAIEAGTDFGISHGLAVGVGMVVAVKYAKQTGLLSEQGAARTAHLIDHVKSIMGEGLVSVLAMPPSIDLSMVMEKFDNDKKHRTNAYRVVLPKADGGLELISVPRTDTVRNQIRVAYAAGLKDIAYPGF